MLVSGTTGWDKAMSTRHALLNSLLHGDASGYDLVKRFRPSAAHWWHPKPAQMYTELAHMETDGLVSAETVIQTKYPNKRVFSLTDAGRDELRRYAEVPSPPAEFKDELVIKMMGIDVADRVGAARRPRPAPQVVRRATAQRPRERRAMLDDRDPTASSSRPTTSASTCGGSARSALMQSTIDWCDAVADVIERRRPASVSQRTA